jgi:hypothetical protein
MDMLDHPINIGFTPNNIVDDLTARYSMPIAENATEIDVGISQYFDQSIFLTGNMGYPFLFTEDQITQFPNIRFW